MRNFIEILISEKKNFIFGFIIILIILCTVYQLKLVGIAAVEDSKVIEMAETMETNTIENLESTLEKNSEENTNEITKDVLNTEENIVETYIENDTKEDIDNENIENNNIIEEVTIENDITNDDLEQNIENVNSNEIPTELTFNNEEYKVTISAMADGSLKDIENVVVTQITTENYAKEYNNILYKLNQKIKSEDNLKELAGFLAYDIKLIDNLGNEKEPDGNVNISIEYKKLPNLVVENSDLEVSVIHFDNSNNDEKLVEYSQEEDNLTVEKNAENQIKKLEFKTDSFSTFTIAWITENATLANITVHYVDSEGNELKGSTTQSVNVELNDIIDLSTYIGTIIGYVYKDAHYISYDGNVITSIGFENNDTQNDSANVNLYQETEVIDSLKYSGKTIEINLYLVYYKIGNLSIEDDIKKNGILRAVLKDSNGNILSNQNDNSKLVWYRCNTAKGTYTEDERALIGNSSTLYNISADGTEINVALDKGARQYYKVKLINNEGTVLVESSAVQVEYYDDVQNGGFENVNIASISYQGNSWGNTSRGLIRQLPNGTNNLIWKTTGADSKIEIARNGTYDNEKLQYYYKNNTGAVEGEQFAELNCEKAGALYQDVLTAPGEVLNWSLYHRGRYGTDTMYVVAIATEHAEDITSYEEVQAIINNPTDYPGVYCVEITDGNTAWGYHTGSFVIPENQYLTRFFFVAGETSTGGATEGNLIDNIVLSQDIIKQQPKVGESVITIKKVIQNVPYSIKNVQNESLNILLNTNETINQQISTFAYDQQNQNWFAIKTITLKNASSITVNITESNFAENFENYSFSNAKYTLVNDTTGVITGGNLVDDTISDIVLNSGNNYTLIIENIYEENYTSLTINKLNIYGTKLTGSAFKIYESGTNGESVTATEDISDGTNDGKIKFENLKYNTEYIIEEVTAPNKYYLLETPIHVKITFDNGVQILNSDQFKEGYVTKTENTSNELNIVNIKHVEMPKAGGIGNHWIYILGIFIMGSTVIIYNKITKERRRFYEKNK